MSSFNFESYADLTGSLADLSVEQLVLSGSDVNLNIDYNNFNNHVFFSSAATKLENFKSKVSNIEGYLNTISSSLSGSGIALSGDSTGKKDLRKSSFSNIQDIIDTFSSYERFLYYDHQSQITASIPGLGINLAHTVPVVGSYTKLTNYDGFKLVFKHTGSDAINNDGMNYFKGKYRAEEKPFFNYSGSLYLSFLLKGASEITSMRHENRNLYYEKDGKATLPSESFASQSILSPIITGSRWQRFIFAASQSYWRPAAPSGAETVFGNIPNSVGKVDFGDQDTYNILSQSEDIQSASGIPSSGSSYPIILEGDFYPSIGTIVTASGMPFTGSIMPAGELFRISGSFDGAGSANAVTASYMTDIKITTKNPLNVLPFSYTYKTGSTEWNDWYTGLYASASAYDSKNIHSFINNLPTAIQDDVDATDLKQFLNMLGEHFDLIRNYIDNYQTFYKRRYNKLESVPTNLLPILANNLGWDVMQLFTGSLQEYFGTSEEDIKVGGRSTEEITHNTWRKVLNNLIYIYKTKGTLTGVDALLNVYGYPSDVLTLQEIGGSSQEHTPTTITENITNLLEGVGGSAGNVSFVKDVEELYSWIFNNNNARTLNSNWWTNKAVDLDTIEFILKPHKCLNNDQILLQSSGSKNEKLWDVQLLASGSDTTVGKLQFRLNNTATGSDEIASNAVSMSTEYLPLKTGTDLWNVMLQRMTSSISGAGTQEYKLFAGLQDGDKITQFSAVSMSVNGAAQAQATASFTFIQSASNEAKITLTSTNATEKTYVALSGSANGSLSGSFVLFATGSGTTEGAGSASVAGNLLAAITSSNGHGNKFSVTQDLGVVTLTQNIAGHNGNRLVTTAENFNNVTNPNAPGSFVGGTTDTNFYANQNWLSTGSLNPSASDNLYIGATYTGSLAEFRVWTTALSASKFKQHILNKKSTVGNNINASRDEITYRYALQENWKHGVSTPQIKDSNSKNVSDYTFNISTDLLTSSVLYDKDDIDIVKFSIRIGGTGQPDENRILLNPTVDIKRNLSPFESSEVSIYEPNKFDEKLRYHTSKLQITRSPQKILNDFIIDNLADYDITGKFADPRDLYKTSYIDLDKLRDDLFNHFNVVIDINKWIRAQANIFNPSMIGAIQDVLPARSTVQDIGVMFEPTLLERDKIKNPQALVATGSAIGQLEFEHDMIQYHGLADSIYISSKDAEYSIVDLIGKSGFYLDTKNVKYDVEDNITKEMFYISSKDVKYNVEDNITKEMFYIPSKNAKYNVEDNITKEMFYIPSKNAKYNVEDNITKEMFYISSKNVKYDVEGNITKEMLYQPSKDTEIGFIDSTTKKGKILSTYGKQASATFGGDGVNMENNNGTTLILTNTDGTSVTFTTDNSKTENQSTATAIGTDYTSVNDSRATRSFHNAFAAAISAGTLKMTLTPATHADETTITLTQDVAGTNGNKTITNPSNMYVQGELLSSGTTKVFIGGTIIDVKVSDETKSPVMTQLISYQPSKDAKYNIEGNITKEMSYIPSKDAKYNIEGNITKEMSYIPSKNVKYDVEGSITKEISYIPSKNIKYDIEGNITKEIVFNLSHDAEYNVTDNIIKTGNIENIIEGFEPWITSQSYASFVNLADSWGTSTESVHFLAHVSGTELGNVGYYEQDFVVNIVGDIEFILGQFKISPFDYEGDNRMTTYRANYRKMAFDNPDFFLNREIRDKGKGYTYESYVRKSSTDTFEGVQDGRPVGKTSYYVTRSNGDLVYPSNHWIHFSEDSLRSNFIKGTQNIGGRYMQLNRWEDYSTASFYSINVTGEDELVVMRGKATKGNDGTVQR